MTETTTTTTSNLASREALLATGTRRYLDLTLPVSRLAIRIQSLTEGEYMRYASTVLTDSSKGRNKREQIAQARRKLFVICMVDIEGNRLLMDSDVKSMAKMDIADAQFLHQECETHCGLDGGEVEKLVKNSEQIDV